MRVLLTPIGSRGDLQPAIALGQALQRAGHEVRILGSPNGAQLASQRGLAFEGLGQDIRALLSEQAATVSRPWVTLYRFVGLLRDALEEVFAEESLARLEEAARWSDLIVGGGVPAGLESIAELHQRPYRMLLYCPVLLSSPDHPPMLPWTWMPSWVNRLSWWAVRRLADLIFLRGINQRRERLGLGPAESMLEAAFPKGQLLFASDERLAPIPPAWAGEGASTGFFHLESPSASLPDWLESFLSAGPPPIYVGFGSMTDPRPDETTRRLSEAATRAGVRLVISRGWAGLGEPSLPSGCVVVGDCPHDLLLPRMAAAVHHGGAGTTASCARAGIPQVAIPHLMDQYYWADRLHRAGLGPRGVSKRRLTVRGMTRVFKGLSDPAYRSRAAELGEALRQRDGLSEAVRYLEGVVAAGSPEG